MGSLILACVGAGRPAGITVQASPHSPGIPSHRTTFPLHSPAPFCLLLPLASPHPEKPLHWPKGRLSSACPPFSCCLSSSTSTGTNVYVCYMFMACLLQHWAKTSSLHWTSTIIGLLPECFNHFLPLVPFHITGKKCSHFGVTWCDPTPYDTSEGAWQQEQLNHETTFCHKLGTRLPKLNSLRSQWHILPTLPPFQRNNLDLKLLFWVQAYPLYPG